jgi:hypothetical protein
VDKFNEAIEVFRGNLLDIRNSFIGGKGHLQLHFAGRSSRRNDSGFRRKALPTQRCPCMRPQPEEPVVSIQGPASRLGTT